MNIAGFRTGRLAYDYLRCFNWMKAWEKLGHEVKFSTEYVPQSLSVHHFDYELDRLGEWCDVLFTTVETLIPEVAERILALRDKHGFTLVCDNDDPLSIVPADSQAGVESLLRGADLVTFISPVIASDYGHLTRRYIIQPTCLPEAALDIPAIKGKVNAKKVNLIVMGWPYHKEDVWTIHEDLETLLRSDKYRLISIGIWDDWMGKYGPDTLIHSPHVRSWETLIGFMKGIPRSIALVPIRANCQATRYNNNAKFLDYTAAGIPMLVSDVENAAFLDVEAIKVSGSWADSITNVSRRELLKTREAAHARLMRDFIVERQAAQFLQRITDSIGDVAEAL